MGLEKTWIQGFIAALIDRSIPFTTQGDAAILLNDQQIVRLISLNAIPDSIHFSQERIELELAGFQVYNLWEDVWQSKSSQVLNRLLYFSNLTERIHGRKCKVQPLNNIDFKSFLNAHHLQSSIPCKIRYGLFYQGVLVAVAGFNQLLMPSKGDNYRSSELLRYCTLPGINIPGGLSKLLKAHFKFDGFDDVMSYADRDWSNGVGYNSLKFNFIGETPKVNFHVNIEDYERISSLKFRNKLKCLSKPELAKFVEVFNSGNLKFIYKGEQFK